MNRRKFIQATAAAGISASAIGSAAAHSNECEGPELAELRIRHKFSGEDEVGGNDMTCIVVAGELTGIPNDDLKQVEVHIDFMDPEYGKVYTAQASTEDATDYQEGSWHFVETVLFEKKRGGGVESVEGQAKIHK